MTYKTMYSSRDMDVHGEFDTIEPLQATGDPYDPFALQKACLLACGIIPREGHTLGEILERLGSGFVMHSEVRNVPKGSGLGTSSILSAACVKAVFEFMGIAYTEEDLYVVCAGCSQGCKSDVLKFLLEDNCSLVVRPSGTEPKLKIYISVSAENKEMAEEVEDEIAKTAEKWIC